MNDKQAAKKIIKRRKQNKNLYTAEDVKYAKMIRKRIRQNETKAKEK